MDVVTASTSASLNVAVHPSLRRGKIGHCCVKKWCLDSPCYPIAPIKLSVAPWGSPTSQVRVAPGFDDLFSQLATRLPAAHHQYRPWWKCSFVGVVLRVNDVKVRRQLRRRCRSMRFLVGTGGEYDFPSANHPA